MSNDWIKVRTYTKSIEAEIVKQMLEENGVAAVILNQQDSSYFFGKIDLYVKQADETIANVLINSGTFTEEDNAN